MMITLLLLMMMTVMMMMMIKAGRRRTAPFFACILQLIVIATTTTTITTAQPSAVFACCFANPHLNPDSSFHADADHRNWFHIDTDDDEINKYNHSLISLSYGSCDDIPVASGVTTAAQFTACWTAAQLHFANTTVDPALDNNTRPSVYQFFMIVLGEKDQRFKGGVQIEKTEFVTERDDREAVGDGVAVEDGHRQCCVVVVVVELVVAVTLLTQCFSVLQMDCCI